MDHKEWLLAKIPGPNDQPQDTSLLYLVRAGLIQVPRFQRDFKWGPGDILSLLHSVARNWPSGLLLLAEGGRQAPNFPTRPLRVFTDDEADAISETPPAYSILDGQQRLTALYRAMFDADQKRTFFLRIGQCVDAGGVVEDGSFDVVTTSAWGKATPTELEQARPSRRRAQTSIAARDLAQEGRVVRLSDMFSGSSWNKWIEHLSAEENIDEETVQRYDAFREQLVDTLKAYRYPVTVIGRNESTEILTSVFVTVNTRGQQLKTFDLASAMYWRDPSDDSPGFDIRDLWFRANGRTVDDDRLFQRPFPNAIRNLANFDLEPESLLRLLRLLADDQRAVSQTELISMEQDHVETHAAGAIRALDDALSFLVEHAAVVPESLPSEPGILPIAYVLYADPSAATTASKQRKLLRWFWVTTFGQRYGRGQTNTYVVADARELRAWVSGGSPVEPQALRGLIDWTTERLLVEKSGNDMLQKGVYCLENATAVDWIGIEARAGVPQFIKNHGRQPVGAENGEPLSWQPMRVLDEHHVFPADTNPEIFSAGEPQSSFAEQIPTDDGCVQIVANRCLLLKSTNIRVGTRTPGELANVPGINLDWCQTYLFEWDQRDTWRGFIESRCHAIDRRLHEVLGGLGHVWGEEGDPQ